MIICFSSLVQGQDLSKYQWKNRLIVLQAENELDSLAVEQIEILRSDSKVLSDRKLKLIINYHTFGKVEHGMPVREEPWKFQVKLIGLDGEVKFTSEKVEPIATFIDLIDAMPMRREELRNKKN